MNVLSVLKLSRSMNSLKVHRYLLNRLCFTVVIKFCYIAVMDKDDHLDTYTCQ